MTRPIPSRELMNGVAVSADLLAGSMIAALGPAETLASRVEIERYVAHIVAWTMSADAPALAMAPARQQALNEAALRVIADWDGDRLVAAAAWQLALLARTVAEPDHRAA